MNNVFEIATVNDNGEPLVFAPSEERATELYRASHDLATFDEEDRAAIEGPHKWVPVTQASEIGDGVARLIDRLHPYRAGEIIETAVRNGTVYWLS